jgi:GNAT superfamily N-acetyltransferase
LGWIGKSALLVTEEFGPAVRLATVLTNAKFEVGKPISSSRCGDCEKCVVHCRAKAISGRNWKVGLEREAIYDAFACCDTARKLSKRISLPSTLVICGICINVCPWTEKYISRGSASQENWTALRVFPVETDQDIESVRVLFAEYGDFLKKELASYEGQPAGCVAFGELSDGRCEMKRLFVREAYQRKGIGTVLCETLIACAKRSGYTYIRLATALEPPKALYKSLGFREIPPYRDIPREIERVAHMELRII